MEEKQPELFTINVSDGADTKCTQVCKLFTPYSVSLTGPLHSRLVQAVDESDYALNYWLHALLQALLKPLRVVRERYQERIYAQAELPDPTDVICVTAPKSESDPSPHVVIGHRGEL